MKDGLWPYIHLIAWLKHFDPVAKNAGLEPRATLLFPKLTLSSGGVRLTNSFDSTGFIAIIKSLCEQSGMPAQVPGFNYNCIRRGGAQFWLMKAPHPHRMTMDQLKVWGGWSENMDSDTLMKYILDDLDVSKNSVTFFHHPKRFIQYHDLRDDCMDPISLVHEMRVYKMELKESYADLSKKMDGVIATLASLIQSIQAGKAPTVPQGIPANVTAASQVEIADSPKPPIKRRKFVNSLPGLIDGIDSRLSGWQDYVKLWTEGLQTKGYLYPVSDKSKYSDEERYSKKHQFSKVKQIGQEYVKFVQVFGEERGRQSFIDHHAGGNFKICTEALLKSIRVNAFKPALAPPPPSPSASTTSSSSSDSS